MKHKRNSQANSYSITSASLSYNIFMNPSRSTEDTISSATGDESHRTTLPQDFFDVPIRFLDTPIPGLLDEFDMTGDVVRAIEELYFGPKPTAPAAADDDDDEGDLWEGATVVTKGGDAIIFDSTHPCESSDTGVTKGSTAVLYDDHRRSFGRGVSYHVDTGDSRSLKKTVGSPALPADPAAKGTPTFLEMTSSATASSSLPKPPLASSLTHLQLNTAGCSFVDPVNAPAVTRNTDLDKYNTIYLSVACDGSEVTPNNVCEEVHSGLLQAGVSGAVQINSFNPNACTFDAIVYANSALVVGVLVSVFSRPNVVVVESAEKPTTGYAIEISRRGGDRYVFSDIQNAIYLHLQKVFVMVSEDGAPRGLLTYDDLPGFHTPMVARDPSAPAPALPVARDVAGMLLPLTSSVSSKFVDVSLPAFQGVVMLLMDVYGGDGEVSDAVREEREALFRAMQEHNLVRNLVASSCTWIKDIQLCAISGLKAMSLYEPFRPLIADYGGISSLVHGVRLAKATSLIQRREALCALQYLALDAESCELLTTFGGQALLQELSGAKECDAVSQKYAREAMRNLDATVKKKLGHASVSAGRIFT